MNPEIIKAKMRTRGVSATDISRSVGVTPSAVHRVIQGTRTSQRIAIAVSGAIGIPINKIWPQTESSISTSKNGGDHINLNKAMHKPLPYPQTPKSAHTYFESHGICVSHWAKKMGVPRTIVVDLLRERLKGHMGSAHKAAVALGFKLEPKMSTPPNEAQQRIFKQPPYKEYGLRLKHERENANLTQHALAIKAGISHAAIAAYERGSSIPKRAYAIRLEKAGINMHTVFSSSPVPFAELIETTPSVRIQTTSKTSGDPIHIKSVTSSGNLITIQIEVLS